VTRPLLTAKELAAQLGVSTGALLRWRRDGRIPAVKLPSGAIRYLPERIDAWLEAQEMAGGGTENGPPVPDAARRREVSSVMPPVPPRPVAARTEENRDAWT
jgi:excisionase family DNA binding protein